MPKTKTVPSKTPDLVSFRLTEDVATLLDRYSQGQTTYDGRALSVSQVAKKIVTEFLKDHFKKK